MAGTDSKVLIKYSLTSPKIPVRLRPAPIGRDKPPEGIFLFIYIIRPVSGARIRSSVAEPAGRWPAQTQVRLLPDPLS